MADYSKWVSSGKGAGRTAALKSAGPRNPLNQHASRMLERVVDLQEAAKKRVLSPQDYERAADAALQFKGSQQVFQKFSAGGDPMMAEAAKFTRSGGAGTIDPSTLKKVGLPAGASFEEIAAKASRVFEELRRGALGAKMKSAAAALPEDVSVGLAKSGALRLLKGIGLAGALGALQPVPTMEDVQKAKAERELEAVKSKGA